jgi:GNAT superfamily N-acetyltransferase
VPVPDTLDLAVRRLAPGDLDLVAHLEQVGRSGAVHYRGADVLLEEVPEIGDWASLVGDEHRPVWVATVDGVAAGFLAAEVRDHVLRVRQVFVHPGARDLGLGDDLLAAAVEAARTAGCRRLEGVALPGDRLTKNLYERAGITARAIVVSVALD